MRGRRSHEQKVAIQLNDAGMISPFQKSLCGADNGFVLFCFLVASFYFPNHHFTSHSSQ